MTNWNQGGGVTPPKEFIVRGEIYPDPLKMVERRGTWWWWRCTGVVVSIPTWLIMYGKSHTINSLWGVTYPGGGGLVW